MQLADSQAIPKLQLAPSWPRRVFPNNEWVLLLVIALECVIFSITGNNFASAANAFEITRLSVEVGLLALALTLIIITGGIDLSVGSMIGLSAVVLGALWRDAHLPMAVAILATLLVGIAGGGLNAFMISRLGFPPLIVTLGTFSLFRGIAEGLTRGVENYSGFSPLNYLINIRISEAIKLLKRPDVNVTDIALDTGFYSSQHFATTFKKLTGYTPSEFRKKNIPTTD